MGRCVNDGACGPSLSFVVIGNDYSFAFLELWTLLVDLWGLLGLLGLLFGFDAFFGEEFVETIGEGLQLLGDAINLFVTVGVAVLHQLN